MGWITAPPGSAALDEKRRSCFAWKATLRKSAGYCSGDVDLSDEEIARRVEAYEPPEPLYRRGVMAKYAASVSSASKGSVIS